MENFVPYDKLSKKEKKKRDKERRKGWGAINPVTRKSKNPNAYNRNSEKRITRSETQT